jgi:hypothetical protein
MARIERGTRPYKRGNAKNYTNKQAQLRLDEVVAPFNQQVINSLFVDAVEIEYYQRVASIGKPCTCNKIEVLSPEQRQQIALDGEPNASFLSSIVPAVDGNSAGASIHLKKNNLFGDSSAEKMYDDVHVVDITGNTLERDVDDIPEALYQELETQAGDSQYENTSMFGGVTNCGICYKTGYQPGYRAYGKQRHVLTTWDIENTSGYYVRTSETPNTIARQGNPKTSYVEFSVEVPKYFKGCTISVRNNTQILEDLIFVTEYPLSIDLLRTFAGRNIPLEVRALEFTHVVIEFDLGVDRIRANLGVESHTLDYERLEAIENFPVILPPTIHEVEVGDVIVIPDRVLALKITDKERKITATKRRLEWSVQTRLLQKLEPLRHINRGTRIR